MTTGARLDIVAPPGNSLVAGLLDTSQNSEILSAFEAAAMRVSFRARQPRLRCYAMNASSCPAQAGWTYACRTCAQEQVGPISEMEAGLEMTLLLLAGVFNLGEGP